jgi:hypothetical protein
MVIVGCSLSSKLFAAVREAFSIEYADDEVYSRFRNTDVSMRLS